MPTTSTGLCGQNYTLESPIAACQVTKNLYPEIIDDPDEEKRIVLNSTPGLVDWATVGIGPIRGHLQCLDGNFYVVSGNQVYSVTSAGVATLLGTISNAMGQPVSMSASTSQLFIISDGLGYYVSGGVLAQVVDPDFPASVLKGDFSDGYFLVITSTRFYISALNDVTSWDALDFTTVQASANTLVSMGVVKRRVIILGSQISQIFDNTGNADFPYEADPAGILNYGCVGAFAAIAPSNGFVSVASDKNGNGIVVDESGRKISSLSVDLALQGYSTLADVIACTFQFHGHEFVQITFPTAKATHRYDLTTGLWHQAEYWNQMSGEWNAHLGLFHSFAFSKHLMGSRISGKIYELSGTVYTDAGDLIRRLRRSPHIRNNQLRVFYNWLEVVMQVGVGLNVISSARGYDPQLVLRYSDDGGRTWSQDIQTSVGKVGEYGTRVIFNNLGSAHDRVFEIEFSDIVPCRITAGFVNYDVALAA